MTEAARDRTGLGRRAALLLPLGLAAPGLALGQAPPAGVVPAGGASASPARVAGAASGLAPDLAPGLAPDLVPGPAFALTDALMAGSALLDPGGNHVVSPWSIRAALGLLALGAQGRTARDFNQMLGVAGPGPAAMAASLRAARLALARANSPGATITHGEAAWCGLNRSFRPEWQALARDALNTRGRRIDFAAPSAARLINGWARRATRGLIPTLLDQVAARTEFILASAIHFAGTWETPFLPAATRPAPFTTLAGISTDVPMMQGEFVMEYGRNGPGHVVRLPYAGGRLSMWLATAEQPANLPAFLALLRSQGTAAWLRATALTSTRTTLRLPRFSFASGGDLLPLLNRIGLAPALGGDLRGITGHPATITAILHRARIGVNEAGTVAAAATAVIATRSMNLTMPEFNANRPFAFMISPPDTTAPLFIGLVGDAANAQG